MTRVARPADTGGDHELATFAGRTGATMPRHAHRGSHAALLVMGGEVEVELDGRRWLHDARRLRQPAAGHAARLDDEVGPGAARALHDERSGGRGVRRDGRAARRRLSRRRRRTHAIAGGKLALARLPAISSWRRETAPAPEPVRVTNLVLPVTPGPYVLLDGGGERFGGNTFLAQNANTSGQFLFIITEGGAGRASAPTSMRGTSRTSSARRRDAGLGVRQGRVAQDRRLLPGAAAEPARLPADAGLQPVRGVPHARHLRKLLHARRHGQNGVGGARVRPPAATRGRRGAAVADVPARPREARGGAGGGTTCSARCR